MDLSLGGGVLDRGHVVEVCKTAELNMQRQVVSHLQIDSQVKFEKKNVKRKYNTR